MKVQTGNIAGAQRRLRTRDGFARVLLAIGGGTGLGFGGKLTFEGNP